MPHALSTNRMPHAIKHDFAQTCSKSNPSKHAPSQKRILSAVFVCLLVDIFSFSIILPLLPRLLEHYRVSEQQESASAIGGGSTMFSASINALRSWKEILGVRGSDLDIVLFGGWISATFSLLQCIVSPFIGRLSDKYGRRRILIACMVGNILSCALWVAATRFPVFVLSRIIAGLSEGNVQLSVAIISDITSAEQRSRGLALVGLAFALGFTLGPSLGALVTSLKLEIGSSYLHPYFAPAMLSLALVVIELLLIVFLIPETRGFSKPQSAKSYKVDDDAAELTIGRQKAVSKIGAIHFSFIFLFSGLEFTIPFLAYDIFKFSHTQQGKLFASIGLLSATIQSTYTRRFARKIGERVVAAQGIIACSIAALALSLQTGCTKIYVAAVFLAITSGTVVTSLTALCSLACGTATNSGHVLGTFRSMGQLGRAIGPISASVSYWLLGPSLTYIIISIGLLLVNLNLYRVKPIIFASNDKQKEKDS